MSQTNTKALAEQPVKKSSRQVDIWCRNNASWTTAIFLFVSLNVLMFSWGYNLVELPPGRMRVALGIAKGTGRVLSFSLAILFLSCCKVALTALRDVVLKGIVLPLDFVPIFHRLAGSTVLLAGLIHTCAHLSYWFMGATSLGSPTKWFSDLQFMVTGEVMVVFLLVIGVSALPSVRKSSMGMRFFSAAHAPSAGILLIAVFLHSTTALLAFLAPPAILFFVDLIIRLTRVSKSRVSVVRCDALEDDSLVRLEIERPAGFVFKAGQYVYLNIGSISKTEFHPFTIASAPADQTLLFFIKDAGRWTHKLFRMAKNLKNDSDIEAGVSLDVSILGPYGAPTQEVRRFRQIMLIATGVGVTPMLSIYKHYVQSNPKKQTTDESLCSTSSEESSSSCGQECSSDLKRMKMSPPAAEVSVGNSSRLVAQSSRRLLDELRSRTSHQMLDELRSSRSKAVGFSEDQPGEINETNKQLSYRLMAEVLSGDQAFEEETSKSIVLEANNWLRGSAVVTGFSWLALAALIGIQTAVLGGAGPALRIAIILVLGIQAAVLLCVVTFGIVGFGGDYCVSAFFGWDILPALMCLAALGMVASTSYMSLALGFFQVAQVICFLRLTFTLWIAASHSRSNNGPTYKPSEVDRIHFVWVTRSLKEAKWLIEEIDEWEPANQEKYSSTFYLTREQDNVITDYEKLRANKAGRLETGRPDWFKELNDFHQGCHGSLCGESTGVFFCGQAAIGASIRRASTTVELLLGHNACTSNMLNEDCHCRLAYHEENF